jgi:Mn2+/Fe2+ NRAMP family transporter
MPEWTKDDSADTRASSYQSSRKEAQTEDAQDLAIARAYPEKAGAQKPWWHSVGPGLITGAADDDPSGIGTYSVAGVQFGYQLLWLVPFCLPLMIAVQEMCGRIGVVTGKGLAAAIKQHYPKWMLTVLFLGAATGFLIWAMITGKTLY